MIEILLFWVIVIILALQEAQIVRLKMEMDLCGSERREAERRLEAHECDPGCL